MATASTCQPSWLSPWASVGAASCDCGRQMVGVAAVEAAAVVAVGGVGKTSSSLAALPAPTRVGLSAQWLFTHSAVDWPTAAKRVAP